MANQFQVDKSSDFASRMTLINEVSSDKYLEQHRRNMEEQNFLREIANDVQTPKNKRQQNTDGLFETTDCSHPDHQCTCGDEQMTLTED